MSSKKLSKNSGQSPAGQQTGNSAYETTLNYILEKYNLVLEQRSPIDIPISRWKEFPQLLTELGFKTGAEIGVLKGQYTETLCKAGLKMYGIDAWQFYHTYNDFRKQHQLDSFEKEARERLANYECDIVKGWSMDAVKQFKDESLDFVFIDGNHDFRHVTDDIDEWKKKVRPGGIVAGHDYFRTKSGSNFMHVKDVVPAYCYAYKIKPWFVIRNDKCPSWFYVKS